VDNSDSTRRTNIPPFNTLDRHVQGTPSKPSEQVRSKLMDILLEHHWDDERKGCAGESCDWVARRPGLTERAHHAAHVSSQLREAGLIVKDLP